MAGSLLRPNQLTVKRQTKSAVGPTGLPAVTTSTTYTDLPALIDQAPRVAGKVEFSIAGEVIEETDYGFVDGLMPRYFAGLNPGDSFTHNGFTYVVAANGRAAFPDIKPYDVVVREDGTAYLVIGANEYYDVLPMMMLHLNFGRAWKSD